MTSKYFFDTYAIIEVIRGNDKYSSYLDDEIVINNFIFAELCYILYRDKDKVVREHLREYSKYINSVNPEWIEEAMKFRIEWKDRNVSVTDCIGYIMAKRIGIPFLTGDKDFECMENVEFVR